MKKVLAIILTLICTLSLLCACGNQEPAAEGEKTFTIQVVHADGTVMEQEITTETQFLALALIEQGILTDEGLETGMYLTVDGETASWEKDQAYWGFYVDGEYATKGMNDTAIVDGAVYKLEYTVG